MTEVLSVGCKVKVMRQIGKNGIPTETNGRIKHFSEQITVGGERTAFVQCEDEKNGDGYWYPISKIQVQSGSEHN